MEKLQRNYRHQEQHLSPPTGRVWETAIDPATGRTYYFDSVTRETQWEKPPEIKAMERAKRKEKRRQDKLFFKEMERNIHNSLARGERAPSAPSILQNNSTKQNMMQRSFVAPSCSSAPNMEAMMQTNPTLDNNNDNHTQSRVRTISGMDEIILWKELAPPDRARAPSRGTTNVPEQPIAKPVMVQRTASAPFVVPATTTDVCGRPPRPTVVKNGGVGLRPPLANGRQEDGSLDNHQHHQQQKQQQHPLMRNKRGEGILDGPMQEGAAPTNQEQSHSKRQPKHIAKPPQIHLRRNTGEIIHVQNTMTNPNVDATIKCVCGVFRAHILQAYSQQGKPSLLPHLAELLPVFNDYDSSLRQPSNQIVPSLDEIYCFYQDFFKRSQMEHDTIIMSLIYVERLIKETNGAISPLPQNWMSVLFSSMVLASKVWDDLSMWNIDFSNVCGKRTCFDSFTLRRINQLEVALLKSLQFCVKVPASEYAKYYFLIRSILIKSGLLHENNGNEDANCNDNDLRAPKWNSQSLCDMQGAQNLETLSSNYQDAFQGLKGTDDDTHIRQTKSMDAGCFTKFPPIEPTFPQQEKELQATATIAGPVLRQSVCLQQLVSL